MNHQKARIASVLATSLALATTLPAYAESSANGTKSIQGSWEGDFGAGNWTFVFENSNRTWAGRYTYPQYKGWNPVTNLAANDRSAKFSLKAKTSVDFNLRLDPSSDVLSGTVRFGQGKTAGSPPVTLPVKFKRK